LSIRVARAWRLRWSLLRRGGVRHDPGLGGVLEVLLAGGEQVRADGGLAGGADRVRLSSA